MAPPTNDNYPKDRFHEDVALGQDGPFTPDESTPMARMSSFEETLIKLSFNAGYIYMLLAITGILLNAYVIIRLVQLAFHDYHRFKRGCGLPLATMSISDLCSLISIIMMVVISGFLPQRLISGAMHSARCKITIYMIHTLTGFSTWCWLFISALRYIAVYHPLWHVTGNALGPKTLIIMLVVMLFLNSWLPIVVMYYPKRRDCAEQALTVGADWNRILHLIELLWSYMLPAVLTLALDIKVLLVRPPSFGRNARQRNMATQYRPKVSIGSATSDDCETTTLMNKLIQMLCTSSCVQKQQMPRINVVSEDETRAKLRMSARRQQTYGRASKCEKPKTVAHSQDSWQSTCSRGAAIGSTRRGRQTVRRWLAITTIHLLLNAPDSLLRLANVLRIGPQVNSPISHVVVSIVRLLYFTQFCFNAAYLSTIVYKKNIRLQRRQSTPKTSNANLQIHPEYSRPQTRVGIRDESRRPSKSHVELLRRYSADPRSIRDPDLRYHTHLQVNQPLRSAPLLSSYNSSETFRSEDLEMGSHGSIMGIPLARSPSTEPRNEIAYSPASSGERTSAGLVTFASSAGTNTPILCSRISSAQDDWNEGAEVAPKETEENLWKV